MHRAEVLCEIRCFPPEFITQKGIRYAEIEREQYFSNFQELIHAKWLIHIEIAQLMRTRYCCYF